MSLEAVFSHVDSRKTDFIARLREAVSIQSVSSDPKRRPDVVKMVEWTKVHFEKLGANCELVQLNVEGHNDPPLPPVLFGTLGNDPKKETVLIYGHLDVQPAKKSDGWDSEPFELTDVDGKLFGRGSSDDKGPVVGWINAIESMQACSMEMPVNVKFVLEGMEESGSVGLEELLTKRKEFLSNVQYVCISDNYWLGTKKPCLTYGTRGICYFLVEVSRPTADLHSGIHGGVVHEPMTDLLWLLGQLNDIEGNPNIPGLEEMTRPLTSEERQLYENIDFDVNQYIESTGAALRYSNKVDILMHRARYASLSVHGIEGAFSDNGAKTVIPSKITGKFSIRIVPDMKPEAVNQLVEKHLNKIWKEKRSPNILKVGGVHSGKTWLTDPKGPNFRAAHAAIKRVYGMDPDYTREGGSIPITITLEELTGVSTLLLPIGASDDNPHAQNEKIDTRNYIEGTKLLAAYLVELGKLQ